MSQNSSGHDPELFSTPVGQLNSAGHDTSPHEQAGYQAAPVSPYPAQNPHGGSANVQGASPRGGWGVSITSLCLGIGSLVLLSRVQLWFPYAIFAIPISIAGIILGFMGWRKKPKGRWIALAGLITGFASAVISASLIIMYIAIIFYMGANSPY